jgi:hypothetical protein
MKPGIVFTSGIVALAISFCACVVRADDKIIYETNFEKVDAGKTPEGFLILDGQFTVKEDNGNKVLELPGAPLESYGLQFGPTTNANVAASARFFGTAKGRRYPVFGIGLNGAGGYRLQVAPSKKQLELCKANEVVRGVPFEWKTGEWLWLKLQVREVKDGQFRIEGKVWSQSATEPAEWIITMDDNGEPPPGRASIVASPFSGTPIQFDDFKVTAVNNKP